MSADPTPWSTEVDRAGVLADRDRRIAELGKIVAAKVSELTELRKMAAAFDRHVAGLTAIEALAAELLGRKRVPVRSGKMPDPVLANLHASQEDQSSAAPRFKHAASVEGASSGSSLGNSPSPGDVLPKLNLTARQAGALLLAISPGGFSWDNVLLALCRRPNSGDSRAARKALIEHGLMAVAEGVCFATPELFADTRIMVGRIPSSSDLTGIWIRKLRGPASEMLQSLVDEGPATTTALADRLGKSPTSGWWRQGLKDLRGSNVATDVAGVLEPHRFFKGGL